MELGSYAGRAEALLGQPAWGSLVAREFPCDELARRLCSTVRGLRPGVVGALRLSCADEAEAESSQAFQRFFVRPLLPTRRFSEAAPFRLANLGGRYDWGAFGIAASHFAEAPRSSEGLVVLAKVNAHVGCEEGPGGPVYGALERYGSRRSLLCGALQATLEGSRAPFARDLEDAFSFESVDRLKTLREAVDPRQRVLLAALTSARLQARRLVLDCQETASEVPTLTLVVPCVTVNRVDADTEIVCGVYAIDRLDGKGSEAYLGLGDRPERYAIEFSGGRHRVQEGEDLAPRPARDHRAEVLSAWRRGAGSAAVPEGVRQVLAEARNQPAGHVALQAALGVLGELAPIAGAALLFAGGALEIRHAARVHRLCRGALEDAEARRLLVDLQGRLHELDEERARGVVELLHRELALS